MCSEVWLGVEQVLKIIALGKCEGQGGVKRSSGMMFTVFGSAVEGSMRVPVIRSAALSASAMSGALVLPLVIFGITDASTTRSPSVLRTRRSPSTTAMSSLPIRQLHTGGNRSRRAGE